jgi:hypothetical protein
VKIQVVNVLNNLSLPPNPKLVSREYGVTDYNPTIISIARNQSLLDAAGTVVHETTHAQGIPSEVWTRIMEMLFYITYSNTTGTQSVFQEYMDNGCVVPNGDTYQIDPYMVALNYGTGSSGQATVTDTAGPPANWPLPPASAIPPTSSP